MASTTARRLGVLGVDAVFSIFFHFKLFNFNMKSFLFKPEMITAILEGRKSQTRRILSIQPESDLHTILATAGGKNNGKLGWYLFKDGQPVDGQNVKLFEPKCKIGEVVYAKETWGFNPDYPNIYSHVCYKLNNEHEHDEIKWKSPMFMPEKAARVFLRITNIRIERLNDISEEDAAKEGIRCSEIFIHRQGSHHKCFFNYLQPFVTLDSAKKSFETLWEKINKVGSWDKNPYVFAYEFERVEKCYKDNSFCTCKGLCHNAC